MVLSINRQLTSTQLIEGETEEFLQRGGGGGGGGGGAGRQWPARKLKEAVMLERLR